MTTRLAPVVGLLVALAIAGCASPRSAPPRPVSSPPATADSTSPLTGTIEYRRTGGLAGVDDRITVSRDGLLEVRDRKGRRASARLSAGDLKELEALFAGWSELAGRPRAPVSPDALEYAITYSGVAVTALEFSEPPQTFDLVRKRLEGMAERAR